MDILKSPFDDQLIGCQSNISRFEKQLIKEKDIRNAIITDMVSFYNDQLQNIYFKKKAEGYIGQIHSVFVKNGEFFVHLYLLEITGNSKVLKKYLNVKLFGDEMKDIIPLDETEYKSEFFDYVNDRLKFIENE